MLEVALRQLQRGPVETVGELPPDDPTFEGLRLQLEGPLAVEGLLQATGQEDFLWRATLSGRVRGACRRCLRELSIPLETQVDALFSGDPDAADDPSVYPLDEPINEVDVRPAVREEIALAMPPYLLCREDCAGLCGRCGADLNAGPCGCGALAEPR